MSICRSASHRSSIFCFIPPYVLENIAENGTPLQRTFAVQTMATSKVLRDQREEVVEGQQESDAKVMTEGAGRQRLVYTADFGSGLPGRLLRREGEGASGDTAADEAYDGAGLTYDLYRDAYQRDSLDNQGIALISTVHFQRSYDNAFWNGHQMVYGDGDEDLPESQRLFNRFTISLDVIAHELTHGVTNYEANLNYSGQPGALNESMSDVFGSLVKQRARGQDARTADWIIGEGLLTANVNGVGIRSMKDPGSAYNDPVLGRDPQPGHMRDYVNTTQDNGGVHINSGIPNRAFYIAAYELGGMAWEKAGRIWYQTLVNRLTSTSNFNQAANDTFQIAGELYGANSIEQQAVRKGWSEVGIDVGAIPPPESTGCVQSVMAFFRPRAQ